jgi:hypothetical protein
LLVGELIGEAGAGADRFAAAGQRDEPGAGDGGAGGGDLLGAAEQVQGALAGVFLEQDVAVRCIKDLGQ